MQRRLVYGHIKSWFHGCALHVNYTTIRAGILARRIQPPKKPSKARLQVGTAVRRVIKRKPGATRALNFFLLLQLPTFSATHQPRDESLKARVVCTKSGKKRRRVRTLRRLDCTLRKSWFRNLLTSILWSVEGNARDSTCLVESAQVAEFFVFWTVSSAFDWRLQCVPCNLNNCYCIICTRFAKMQLKQKIVGFKEKKAKNAKSADFT